MGRMRTLAELGEFGVIGRIERMAGRASGRAVRLGMGDDAAVLRPPRGEDVVVSTDAQVEGVHFRWDTAAPAVVGRRTAVAGLSDLAAMGARPLAWLLSLAVPGGLAVGVLDGVVRGLLRETGACGCPLVGGNVARARRTALTITVLGSARPDRLLTRAGARAGDRLLVTGVLGRSALEVARARAGRGRVRHVPRARLEAGRRLARLPGVGGCIDVSDGLEADLGHLLEAADAPLEPRLDRDRIPAPRGFRTACRRAGLDAEGLLLGGGEDYELLFTLRPQGPSEAALARRLGVPVTEIGRLEARGRGSRRRASPEAGWRHF